MGVGSVPLESELSPSIAFSHVFWGYFYLFCLVSGSIYPFSLISGSVSGQSSVVGITAPGAGSLYQIDNTNQLRREVFWGWMVLGCLYAPQNTKTISRHCGHGRWGLPIGAYGLAWCWWHHQPPQAGAAGSALSPRSTICSHFLIIACPNSPGRLFVRYNSYLLFFS